MSKKNLLLSLSSFALLAGAQPAFAKQFELTADQFTEQQILTDGDLTVTLDPLVDLEDSDGKTPNITVNYPGYDPVSFEGTMIYGAFGTMVNTGKVHEKDTVPSVLVMGYTGGAHCCSTGKLVTPNGGKLTVIDLPTVDSLYYEEFPSDIDGDGTIDFALPDNNFYYAFASYAGSMAPTLIYSVWRGQLVDISTDPAFATLHRVNMETAKEYCIGSDDDGSTGEHNGACAAYAASAARLDDPTLMKMVWADVAKYQDKPENRMWLPEDCKVDVPTYLCPDDEKIEFDNLPDALKPFLQDLGYIAKPKDAF